MSKDRISGRPCRTHPNPCPHITGGRCTVCLAMDAIAQIIEDARAEDRLFEDDGSLDRNQVDRIHRLATGRLIPKGA